MAAPHRTLQSSGAAASSTGAIQLPRDPSLSVSVGRLAVPCHTPAWQPIVSSQSGCLLRRSHGRPRGQGPPNLADWRTSAFAP